MPAFWKTKPLSVHPSNDMSLVRETHTFDVTVSKALDWEVFTMENEVATREVLTFLETHYRTDNSLFPIVYTMAHLRFEVGAMPHWWVILRSKKRSVMACIAGSVRSYRHVLKETEEATMEGVLNIGFLCVHPSLRHLGLAPKLIDKISQVAHTSPLCIQRAYYNSATSLPGAFCSSTNYTRPLRFLRCVESAFTIGVPKEIVKRLVATQEMPGYTLRSLKGQTLEETRPFLECIRAFERSERRIYEVLSDERWEAMLDPAATCVDVVGVWDDHGVPWGCFSGVSHPYRSVHPLAIRSEVRSVLLYRYGMPVGWTVAQRQKWWSHCIGYLQSPAHQEAVGIEWDVIHTIQSDVYAAWGFRPSYTYHHYFYNVQMVPLRPEDLTMIGI